ncbi:MAG: ammonia-forming cytochrome c nitrite reductase subunit c552 [Clostridia bacterium]|nr:ammonia-forming cytochrome c nitrite reductase subunit c552 [Clostridia bacterium]
MEKRNQAAKLIIGAVVVIIAVLVLGGIIAGHAIKYKAAPLNRDDIDYKSVQAPEATSADGTITANDWNAIYPDIVFSMGRNIENGDDPDEVVNYLELDPYLIAIYEGYGFAKDYGSARGHAYTLTDVAKTLRPHGNANCLTCKTPNFTKLVNDEGDEVYSRKFDDVYQQLIDNDAETVSCYTCHGNNPGNGTKAKENLTVTHGYITLALGDNLGTIDPGILACGQCHIEYYFDAKTSATRMPHDSIEAMTPEATYEYYKTVLSKDGTPGFYDWEQPSTGAKMLKVQHPEMETVLLGKHAGLLNCADCHMPVVQNKETQNIYHSHLLVSPLKDQTLLESCLVCHGDMGENSVHTTDEMVTFVTNIQNNITAEEKRVGTLLAEFKLMLAAANESKTLSEEQLDEVRELYRKAQWFFDYCYAENSEGAHNSDLARRCLSTAEDLINEGMALLGAE